MSTDQPQQPATEAGRTRKYQGPLAALEDFVRERVERLQNDAADTTGSGRRAAAMASLARLRRAIGSEPGADPLIWEETLAGMPSQFHGKDGVARPEESAAHAAITLYALHQQSRGEKKMHVRGHSMGQATASLAIVDAVRDSSGTVQKSPAVIRRFHALGTASSFAETVHHARGLISQFRAHNIPLDYGRFALDLARLQSGASTANGVRLDWGRDLYFNTSIDNTSEPDSSDSPDATS